MAFFQAIFSEIGLKKGHLTTLRKTTENLNETALVIRDAAGWNFAGFGLCGLRACGFRAKMRARGPRDFIK